MLNVTVALTVLAAARSESRAQAAAAAEAVTETAATETRNATVPFHNATVPSESTLEIARARLVWHCGRRTVVYERAQLGRAPAERVAPGGVGLARKVKSCERPVRAKRVAERGSARVGDAARRQSQPHEGIGLLEKRSKVRRARIAHVVAAQVEVPGWLTRELDGNGQLPCSTRPDARGTQGEAVVHQGALEGVLEARTTLLRRRKAQVLAPRVEDPLGARDRRGVPVPRLWAGR